MAVSGSSPPAISPHAYLGLTAPLRCGRGRALHVQDTDSPAVAMSLAGLKGDAEQAVLREFREEGNGPL